MSKVERLSDLLRARSLAEASHEVHAVAHYYPGFVKLFQYHKPKKKLMTGFVARGRVQRSGGFPSPRSVSEDSRARSLRRTKAKVVAYALCNEHQIFATFTFAKARQDVDLCKERMNNWLKNQKKRTSPNLKYLVVPEFHKDGVSLHFHALLANYEGKLTKAIDPKTDKRRRRGNKGLYNIPSYTSGFTDAVKIGDTSKDQQKVGHYISKYVTKDMPRFKNKNRYWVSHGHRLPLTEDNPPLELFAEVAEWQKTNEFGTTSILPYTGKLTDYLSERGYKSFARSNEK